MDSSFCFFIFFLFQQESGWLNYAVSFIFVYMKTFFNNYYRIEKAIKYLVEHFKEQPNLDEIASYVGLSSSHFQRLFSEWAGISPKKFLEHLTVEALKKELSENKSICIAAENVGLSSQSRVYDLFVHIEAVTPYEYKTRGEHLAIEYGFAMSPFGECFIAWTRRGICAFQFTDDDNDTLIRELKESWNNAFFAENNRIAQEFAFQIFSTNSKNKREPLRLFLKGTPFQLKVWRALLQIPCGKVLSYNQLAELSGNVGATRAVASAIARNPVGYIIPCHRVIRNEGVIGRYRWKSERKALIIGWEKKAF